MYSSNDLPAIDLTGVSLLADDLGGTWLTFTENITPENAQLMVDCYNLLMLIDIESNLGLSISNVIVSEETHITEKKLIIFEMLLDNIIEVLTKFGITLNLDYLEPNSLRLLCKITDLFFIMDGYEDLQSLSIILEAKDIPPSDRFIELFRVLYGLEPGDDEVDQITYLLEDCGVLTLETLRLSLVVLDGEPEVPEYVKHRILANKMFLENTVAVNHIRNNARLGMTFLSLLSYYQIELSSAMETSTEHYVKELFGFALISDVPNDKFWDTIKNIMKDNIDDLTLMFKAEKVAKQLKLPGADDETN